MTLAELNRLDRAAFVATLGGIYEHSPWVAESAWPRRPFANVEFARRAENDREVEFAECLRQIDRIARLRLEALIAR